MIYLMLDLAIYFSTNKHPVGFGIGYIDVYVESHIITKLTVIDYLLI
jgi:hypothetical protein